MSLRWYKKIIFRGFLFKNIWGYEPLKKGQYGRMKKKMRKGQRRWKKEHPHKIVNGKVIFI